MLMHTTVPLIYDGSGANGNWELSMLDALFGLAVFSDNHTMFNHTVELWKQRLPAYFYLYSLDGDTPVPPPRGHPIWYGQDVYNASIDGHCQETCVVPVTNCLLGRSFRPKGCHLLRSHCLCVLCP